MKQQENYILGLDLGTNSIGWACIDESNKKILKAGVRIFDIAENPKNGKSLAEPRRISRLTRRRLKRRRVRLNSIIKLLQNEGFIINKDLVQNPYLGNIWELRSKAIYEKVSNQELAHIIYHISKYRGFKSSKKELDKLENTELKKANKDMDDVLKSYRNSGKNSIAEYFFNTYALERKNIRNKLGKYTNLIKQDLNEEELRLILQTQKELGNQLINDEFVQELFDIFTNRKGLPSFEEKVGKCELEPSYYRAPKDALSSSLFRAWLDLNNLRYKTDEKSPDLFLSLDQRKQLIQLAFDRADEDKEPIETQIKDIIKVCQIDRIDNDGKKIKEYLMNLDMKKIKNSLTFLSYRKLQKVCKELNIWDQIANNTLYIDSVIYCIAYLKEFNNLSKLHDSIIKEGIDLLNWSDDIWKTLFDSLSFDKTMGHSLQAIWQLIPCFQLDDESGNPYTYDKCMNQIYEGKFNNRDSEDCKYLPKFDEYSVVNPVVKRTLNQTRLLINKLISEYGCKPQQINIELAKELGKSKQDRDEIKKQQDKNNSNNDKYKEKCEEYGINNVLAYRLWDEQGGICIYSGKRISLEDIRCNHAEIDHILPISRSGDDSLMNKVLVFSQENQRKSKQTAYEYLSSKGVKELEEYKIRVHSSKNLRRYKKERLLLENFDDKKSQEYKTRHLNDTRYIARLLVQHIDKTIRPKEQLYGYVKTIPGQATSVLRKCWSMGSKNRVKSNGDNESHDHHALDAIIVAGAGTKIKQWEKDITYLTRYNYKEYKNENGKNISLGERALKNIERFGVDIPQPWEDFNKDARDFVKNIFVSRMGKRKVTGEMHAQTIMSRQKNEQLGERVVKTIQLQSLGKTESDVLSKLKNMVDISIENDSTVCGRNSNVYRVIVEHAQRFEWDMELAFSAENAPSMPVKKDNPIHVPKIRKIKVLASAGSKLALSKMSSEKRKAAVDSGDVIRLDLYKKSDGKYFTIPVYAFHYNELPKLEDTDAIFQFSIYKNDYLIFESNKEFKVNGVAYTYFEGYYNTRMSEKQIKLVSDKNNILYYISIANMKEIKKYHIDILGGKHFVASSEYPEQQLTLKEVEAQWNKPEGKK